MNHPRAEWLVEAEAQAMPWAMLELAIDAARCGGKAANLGRLIRAGEPVPEGGVITVAALDTFLRHTGIGERIDARLAMAPDADPATLSAIEADVRLWFDAAPWPEVLAPLLDRIAADMAHSSVWAVRSSAVGEDASRSSCAGLMDSVLNVAAGASAVEAIKQVWASRWSARVLSHERSGRGRLGGMAVIVQRQVAPWVAGVLFTRSPEAGAEDSMLCEYGDGLADRLVAGEVDPARLRIARDGAFVAMDRGDGAPELSQEHVQTFLDAALAAERLFGGPQDMEFALERSGKLWIVQSRPITVAAPVRRRVVWSNANVNENFPDPISPLLYSVVAPGYSAYFDNLGRAFGLAPARLERMQSDLCGIVGVHAGRLYYNLTVIHSVLRQAPFGDRLCDWFDDFTGANDPSSKKSPGRPFVRRARDAMELAWISVRTTWQYLFIERRVRAFESCVDEYARQCAPQHLSALGLVELRDLLRGFLHIRLRRWTNASLADAAAMICYGLLKAIVGRVTQDGEATAAHNDLLKGLSGLKSAEPIEALARLAQSVRDDRGLRHLFETYSGEELLARVRADSACAAFNERIEHYLEQWGFRCSGELMLTVPSFQERPDEVLEIVRSQAAQRDSAPEERLAKQRTDREAATRRVIEAARKRPLVFRLGWPSLATVLRPVLRATQASIGYRERARYKQALLYSRLRCIAMEIGKRLTARGMLNAVEDVFFLTIQELDQLLSGYAMFPDACRSLVAERRALHERFFVQQPPEVFAAEEGDYPDFSAIAAEQTTPENCMRGSSVCGGVAVGPARVLTDVAQTRSLAQGDVLVTKQTDPGWAPAFVAIGGLVLERGGMLSHGAILAREYGIPTVVGVTAATTCIGEGSVVRVDGNRGEVHRVGG